MDDATARALNSINRRFYAEHAADFSATREGPWPGWRRLRERLQAEGLDADLDVLDVGCGNGRLGRFLAAHAPALRYTGLDASRALLELAQAAGSLGEKPELLELDLLEDLLERQPDGLGGLHGPDGLHQPDGLGGLHAPGGPAGLHAPGGPAGLHGPGGRRYTLITLFGVLHHLPGRQHRLALLRGLLGRLRDGGILALTSWRLAQFERFREKVLGWEASPVPLDPQQLEPGDRLLPWGQAESLRYVHFAHEDETAGLIEELGAQVLDRYDADGKETALNRYWLLRPGT